MDPEKQFYTGLDIGTSHTRAVILSSGKNGELSILGYNQVASEGMRRGVPANLTAPAHAIDLMLGEAERMSGYDVNTAITAVGGSSLVSKRTHGLIAFDSPDHQVTEADLERLTDSALGNCPLANREILDITPLEYALDGQTGIKDPLAMSGSHLEVRLSVVSALAQVCENLKKVTAAADVETLRLIPGAVAAAAAVLTDQQKENGVAVVDLGAATTSVAVYEEGDLQYVSVIPAGSQHITNDLAMVLKIDLALAEQLKTRYISCDFDAERSVSIHTGTAGKDERFFERSEVEQVVKDRLDEIFSRVRAGLKSVHYDQRLPEGIVLTGGGARLRDLPIYARESLEAAVKIGLPGTSVALGGVAAEIKKPEFAVSVGLALLGAEESHTIPLRPQNPKKAPKNAKKGHFLKNFLSKF